MNRSYQSALHRVGVFLATLLLSAGVHAADIQVEGAWVRATVPERDSASVFMFITSKQDARLVAASSPASSSVELRTMLHKGGMMKTITVESIALPANRRMDMTSIHNYHLTLTGLKAPLEAGAVLPLTLEFELDDKSAVKLDVQAEIRPLKKARKAKAPQPSGHNH